MRGARRQDRLGRRRLPPPARLLPRSAASGTARQLLGARLLGLVRLRRRRRRVVVVVVLVVVPVLLLLVVVPVLLLLLLLVVVLVRQWGRQRPMGHRCHTVHRPQRAIGSSHQLL